MDKTKDDNPHAVRGSQVDRQSVSVRRFGRSEMVLFVMSLLVLALVLSVARYEEVPPRPGKNKGPEAPARRRSASPKLQSDLTGRRMLLVHSYHEGYPWVDTLNEGVRAVIQGTGVDLSVYYMDTKRHSDVAWKMEAGQGARKEVTEHHPDVILAADDDAQRYFAMSYVNTHIPVVFTGVDADPSKYGYPARNVTGLIERPHLKESLALAQRFRPIRRIAVLSCHDSTSILALGFMKQEPMNVEVAEWLLVDDFDEWKKAIERFNRTVDAIVIRSYQAVKKPGATEIAEPAEVAAWTARHATVPTIAFHDFEITDGLMIGVVKSGQEYGGKAAEYALRILDGTAPRELPIVKPKQGIKMVNCTTARRLGIPCDGEVISDITVVSGP